MVDIVLQSKDAPQRVAVGGEQHEAGFQQARGVGEGRHDYGLRAISSSSPGLISRRKRSANAPA